MRKLLFMLVMLAGLYSALWISGDAGAEWSKAKAEEMCAKNEVAAVYICLGNVVDVVWKDTGKGSTFYKPDSTVVECPPGEPTDMGAECMQLMMPNYCTLDKNICGEKPPEEFPGGETEGEILHEGVPEEQEEVIETPEEQPPAEEQPPGEQPPKQEGPIVVPFGGDNASRGATAAEGQAFDTLALAVIALAVIALVLLYLVFRRTTMH